MAVRGTKLRPAYLRVLEGVRGHQPLRVDPAGELSPGLVNDLAPPKKLKARQQWLWDRYIRRAVWLHTFDETKAYMWVELQAEFERGPSDMTAGKIAQLRALGSELGLDPGTRSRLAADIQPKSKFHGLIGGGENTSEP